jgi:hypothetical protein
MGSGIVDGTLHVALDRYTYGGEMEDEGHANTVGETISLFQLYAWSEMFFT